MRLELAVGFFASTTFLCWVCSEVPKSIMDDYKNRNLSMKRVIFYMLFIIFASSCFVSLLFGLMNSTKPTIKDYLDGKVEMVIEKNIMTSSSGEELIKCDTVFNYKR